MPKVTIYLPEPLATDVRTAHLPVSAICQDALTVALARERVALNPEDLDAVVDRLRLDHGTWKAREFDRGLHDGAFWARRVADREELETLAGLEEHGQFDDVWSIYDVSEGWWTLHEFLGGMAPEDDTDELRRDNPYHEGLVRGAWYVWDRVRLRLVEDAAAEGQQP